jgi:hypothetical protein
VSRILKIGSWESKIGDCADCRSKGVPVAWDDYTQYCAGCLRRVADRLDSEGQAADPAGTGDLSALAISEISDRFVVFEVGEVGETVRYVGKVALLTSWSENDVMMELRSRGYPTGGAVLFTGWPSSTHFEISMGGGDHKFIFQKTG